MLEKMKCTSWFMPLALIGLASLVGSTGCSSAELDEPVEVDAQIEAHETEAHETEAHVTDEAPDVTAWVPGTPIPADTHHEELEHTLQMDWIYEEDSVEALTDHSSLIIEGQIESTRFDVIRSYAQSKEEGRPTGPESGIYTDLPVTIATVKVDEVARAAAGLETPAGEAITQGATVDVMFAGGLLTDGCTLEPHDNPLPKVGEQTVLFLNPHTDAEAPNGVATPLATESMRGVYSVTGGPMGRVLVDDGVVTGSIAPEHATAIENHVGQPVSALLNLIRTQAAIGEYISPDARPGPVVEEEAHRPTDLGWCGVPTFGYRWCRNPAGISYTDYSGWRWPVGSALSEWMYTGISNSLYLQRRTWGDSDVMVYENWYGYNNWYGYTWNWAWGGCMSSSIINLNNTYYTGWHYAKTVATHEVGHSVGLTHYWNCNSIMHTNPVVCGSSITYCDAQAATQLYPY